MQQQENANEMPKRGSPPIVILRTRWPVIIGLQRKTTAKHMTNNKLTNKLDKGQFTHFTLQLPTLHWAVIGFDWLGNPTNHSGTTVSLSPSCLGARFLNHIRFSESN